MCFVSSELDALGDELLMDDDSSYLDEAATAPSIPEGIPGDRSTNRVPDNFWICFLSSCETLHSLLKGDIFFVCSRMAFWWTSSDFLRFLLLKGVIWSNNVQVLYVSYYSSPFVFIQLTLQVFGYSDENQSIFWLMNDRIESCNQAP